MTRRYSQLLLAAVLLCACAAGASARDNATQAGGAGMAASIGQAVSALCPQPCVPLDASGLGSFPWVYQDAQQVFNNSTLAFISARVMPGSLAGSAKLSPAGGFINAYVQVIAKLSYTLNSADQLRVQASSAKAATAAGATVVAYETLFGAITPEAMQTARQACGTEAIQTDIDYVVTYIMGSVWSGRGAAQLQPLTSATMTSADNLQQLLPLTPPQGEPVVAAAQVYLSMTQESSDIMSRVQSGSWEISRLNQNTGYPGSVNGGMLTADPQTGAVSVNYQPGYSISRTIADINRDLSDPSRVFSATISYPDASGTLQNYRLEFSGYTYVPIAPDAWQAATGNGWYAAAPIAEATANEAKDVTGYKFVNAPGYNMNNLAMGGNFGRLTGLLICNAITVSPATQSVAATRAQPFAPTWRSIYLAAPSSSTSLPPLAGTTPLQQQAYVIAGTLEFPTPPTRVLEAAKTIPASLTLRP